MSDKRKISLSPEGIAVPPPGEDFVSCRRCFRAHWYVLHSTADNRLTRVACARCGNEVELHGRPGADHA